MVSGFWFLVPGHLMQCRDPGIRNQKLGTRSHSGKAHFTLLFILFLMAAAATVFAVFTWYGRSSYEQRRQSSADNLKVLHDSVMRFAGKTGEFPGDPNALIGEYLAVEMTVNPSWPEQAGYIYVVDCAKTDPPATILAYENVPSDKQKLGRHVLMLDGQVTLMMQPVFEERISKQQTFWSQQKRPWRVRALGTVQE